MRTFAMRAGGVLVGAALALMTGCAATPEPDTTSETADQNLTESRIARLKDPALEALRKRYDSAEKAETGEFHGYAAGFSWSTKVSLAKGLTAEQLDFLGSQLIVAAKDAEDPLPYGTELHAATLTKKTSVAEGELRLSAGDGAKDLDADVEALRAAGTTVAVFAPKTVVAKAKRTAGALLVVDLKNREALILYGRRGARPLHDECTVTTMHSYEFEEALSKDEYPSVDASEVPLLGDVLLDVGVNRTLSNAGAIEDEERYDMIVTRALGKVSVEASGEFFHARLDVTGNVGTVYGDNDGNKRPNKAATLACSGYAK